MYATCLFCKRALGANEVLERFPVGRRVAFDAEKGRLWVVCPRCERWNLTPLEERWEAIEQAERLYRDTRLRVSTEHIGLARLAEGLELVRIGRPQRPEIAAWRYGDQLGRRRRRRFLTGGMIFASGTVGAAVGLVAAGAVLGGVGALLGIAGALQLGGATEGFARDRLARRPVAWVRDGTGRVLKVQRRHLAQTRLTAGDDGSLGLEVRHTTGRAAIAGDDAARAAAMLFPAANQFGGTSGDVQLAVARLVDAGDAQSYLRRVARMGERLTRVVEADGIPRGDWLSDDTRPESGILALPVSVRLAIEMALHEEQERRALEGELAELERAWRDAEEIGAIADSLLLPPWIEQAIARLR